MTSPGDFAPIDQGRPAPNRQAPPVVGPYAAPGWGQSPPAGPPQSPWSQVAPPEVRPAPGRPGTNPWAVTSLVTGLLALVPVSVGTGVAALLQVRRTGQAGLGLAVGGLVASGVWTLVGLLALAVWMIAPMGLPFGSDPVALGPAGAVDGLTEGECFDVPADPSNAVSVVPCDGLHDGEVFHVWEISASEAPTVEDAAWAADGRCYREFERYVGRSYEDSAFDFGFFTPDPDEWAAGARTGTCVVLPWEDESLTGSVRGSGR